MVIIVMQFSITARQCRGHKQCSIAKRKSHTLLFAQDRN